MAKKKPNQFPKYLPVWIVGGIAIIGLLAFFIAPRFFPEPAVGCTQEAMICPDGSAIGRSGPRCEFSVCPALSPYKPIVLREGSDSASNEKLERIAINDFSLSELFGVLTSPVQDMAIPSVNWSQEVVVGVGMGMRSSSGFDVSFEKYDVDPETGKYRFYVTETKPGNNCFSTQALTQPYEIAKFQIAASDVTSKGYQFIYTENLSDCSAVSL